MLTVRSTINFASQSVPPIIPVVQGDPGRAILFTLADFTIPAGATATYYVQKPSGEAVYNNATIDGNNVLVELTAQSIIEKGDNYGQVRIAVGEDVVTSFDFILLVKEFRGIDAVQSLTEMNIFDKAVEQAAEDIDEVKTDALEAIDDAKDEAIEEVTSSLDAITQEFDSVKNTIGDLSGETVTPTATNNYGIGGSVGQVIETWATTMYWHGIYTVSAGNTYGITTVSDFPQQLVVWFTNASNTIIENHKAFATDHVEMVCTAPTGATKLFVMSYGYDAYHGTVQKVEPLSETVSNLKDDLNIVSDGLDDEITRAKAEEARIEALFTADVSEAVSDWLDEHPEATTTVQDGSLTEAKFSDALKLATVKDYVTPEMYGAVGDGTTDDTTAFQSAVDSGKPVFIPANTTIRIENTVTIKNSTVIFGCGKSSVLLVEGKITTDTDSAHTINLHNFLLDCKKIIGNALEIIKANTSNAQSVLMIYDMYFHNWNNISSETDNAIVYIKGVRESTIENCVVYGDSSAYGSGFEFSADSTHQTVNINIANCTFYNIGTMIDLDNTQSNYVYLAGIKVTGCTFIAGTVGINSEHVDTLFIANSMLDFVQSPIKITSCGVVKIHHNYIQSQSNYCIYVENIEQNETRFGEITNNFLWSTNQNKTTDGIVFQGGDGKITFWTVSGNKSTALNRMISMENCQNCEVAENICHNSNTFFDGNSNSTIINIHDNKADASVTNFNINTHTSCYLSEGNFLGTKKSHARGKYIGTGTGSQRDFTFNHGCFARPDWGNVTTGSGGVGPYSISYDANNVYVTFDTAPIQDKTIILNWEVCI